MHTLSIHDACFRTSKGTALTAGLTLQATTQLRQLRQELLDPWFAPPPPPLTDTQDPALLGDGDSRFIDVQGLRVHYKQIDGDSSRPAVLMLHGFNGSTFNWCASGRMGALLKVVQLKDRSQLERLSVCCSACHVHGNISSLRLPCACLHRPSVASLQTPCCFCSNPL